jgi:phenylpropionate dioxygenase-like ring-hydroxylating dioxygenase large terminal subunit
MNVQHSASQQSIKMLPTEEAVKLRGTGPLPTKPYYDREWWELERKAIFLRSWLNIGHVCEIPEPGNFIRREVEFARASLLIVRGKDGKVRTFHNVCTHRGTQLVEEAAGRRAQFSCRYHQWTYGTDGRLLSAPDFSRFYVAKEDCALKQLRTEVLAGMIFINFDPEPAQTIREFFGPIADELEMLPVARAVDFTEWCYEIDANWKTLFDNFQENYHIRFIHPRTGAQTIGPQNPLGYPTHYGFSGPHRSQTLWKNPDPPAPGPTLVFGYGRAAELAARDDYTFPKTDFKLFPCLHVVGLPPGQQFSQTMMPLGPNRTRSTVRMYWTSPADCASRVFAREFGAMSVRDVLSEDRLAIEAGQRGMASGAIGQVHFQDHEMLLRHLYETVQEKVADYLKEQKAT